jgi:hypothetical protein
MLKTLATCFATLLLIAIALFLLALTYATPTLATPRQPQDDPTPTAPPSSATIAIALPGGAQPVGHPGTQIAINGNGFQPNSTVALYTTADKTQCTPATVSNMQPLPTPAPVTAQANGAIAVTTTWPTNAAQPTTPYYVCAISNTNTVGVSSNTFTVAQNVSVAVSTQTAKPGDTLTVTGANWLPVQPLNVSITPGQGAPPIVTQQVMPNADGTFSVNLAIPQTAAPGSYGVNVTAQNEPTLTTFQGGLVNISAQATPAPTPTSVPTPTSTPTPTPTHSTTPVHKSNNTLSFISFGLGGLGIALVVVGLIMFISYSNVH